MCLKLVKTILAKSFFGKESFRQYQGRKTNKSLNCLAFLDSKKNDYPRIQTFY